MDMILDTLSWAAIILGVVLNIIGGIGMLRLPDFYARIHGASIIDTMGLAFLLIGLGLQTALGIVTVKLVLIFIFVAFSSPTATHALANTALKIGFKPFEPKRSTTTTEETDPSKT